MGARRVVTNDDDDDHDAKRKIPETDSPLLRRSVGGFVECEPPDRARCCHVVDRG
jgi:hypothetical protein